MSFRAYILAYNNTNSAYQQCARVVQTVVKSCNCSTGHNSMWDKNCNSKVNHRNQMRLQDSKGTTHAQHALKRLISTGPNCLFAASSSEKGLLHYVWFKRILCWQDGVSFQCHKTHTAQKHCKCLIQCPNTSKKGMQSGQRNSDNRFWMGVSQHPGGEGLAILLREEDLNPRNYYIVL